MRSLARPLAIFLAIAFVVAAQLLIGCRQVRTVMFLSRVASTPAATLGPTPAADVFSTWEYVPDGASP